MKPPRKALLCQWEKTAWEAVPKVFIEKSFEVCAVSNTLDNQENHMISCLNNNGILASKTEDLMKKFTQLSAENLVTSQDEIQEDEEDNNELVIQEDDDDD